MRNEYTVVPFTPEHLGPAVGLFIETYKQERESSPLLPSRAIDEPEWIANSLHMLGNNPGAVVLHNNKLAAYMLTGFHFPFKGQKAVQVPEYCHASVRKDRPELYRLMYRYLAQGWVNDKRHLHIIGHFAHDSVLQNVLFRLGFGAFLAEELRDLSDIPDTPNLNIIEETSPGKLADLQEEHNQYYRNSPIFLNHHTERERIRAGRISEPEEGQKTFVYYEQGEPCALMVTGESATRPGSEGFLLRNTNTAQIKEAYSRERVRSKGVGKALLQQCINWSKENGYERLFVEHETANYYGGNFWTGFFNPYLYFSMRYVDNTL
ncbi:MAG: GNAT family N-acetyltransferase [Dehalococcoidales bacterium]|nr:GNAT family N-acetyltransferase [Dehalococcoidales bacterium]